MRTSRPVWVKLSAVYPQTTFPPARFRYDERTLITSDEAPGLLHGWYRSTTGEWLGLVSFAVMFGRLDPSSGLQLTDQLVAADALRPRAYGAERRR